MSSPVRTYLDRFRGRFNAVAFFCTCGGENDGIALFADMAEEADCPPSAVLVVTDAEEASGAEWEKVRAFEESVLRPTPMSDNVRRRA